MQKHRFTESFLQYRGTACNTMQLKDVMETKFETLRI